MAVIHSVGTATPSYSFTQADIKSIVSSLVIDPRLRRFLSVFDQTDIANRHFVVHPQFFEKTRSFGERNELFQKSGVDLALEAVQKCFDNQNQIDPSAIDAIISVTSTGVLTPTLDAELINRFGINEQSVRMPFFGLGCAGGASGLARAYDYLKAHPTHSVLLVTTELASIAFHPDHFTPKDIVGAALFADGAAAVILLGKDHSCRTDKHEYQLSGTSSRLKTDTMDLMGWEIKDDGFFVIFSKEIPQLIDSFWKNHLDEFLFSNQLELGEITHFLAHPGGKKILNEMEKILDSDQHVDFSKQVLNQYGNMSSATVLFVLEKFLNANHLAMKGKQIISALGPGFSSELILMERV